ncbi:glucokinase regulatory protein isoform X2 [Acipenser ruthenus]|uniref:glucokinase regulatory protein isoform X2 n=1 Tax=Acipenser ruthenus TaxID=7906 RepID=UPI00145A2767|nr:glucokinase regulatory protein isoform X2 [Acipenser ruthenus]
MINTMFVPQKQKHIMETPDMGKWELAGYEAALPVTEKSNPITREIDKADPVQIVHLLKECDAEIFQEEDDTLVNYKRLYSASVLQTMMDVTKKVEAILKDPEHSLIILSGCGTSGRLAFLLATSFNKLLKGLHKNPSYAYIIAGGDKAILTSQEASEDNPHLGVEALKRVCAGKKKVLFIGISCGLSAPFIAGQLDFCLNNLDVFTPVLVGFNPVNMARNEIIEGWHLTFRQVAEKMEEVQETRRAFILNPAVGPEGISGSSRMKGGSATKIILESLLLAAHKATSNNKEVTAKNLLDWMKTYEKVHKITYSQGKMIAAMVKQAGTSLERMGRIYYIGWQTLGVMGIIDASECVPTFGTDFNDVRGFINKGYKEMANREGDLTSRGPEFEISHEDFMKNVLPDVTENDTVVFIFTLDDDLLEIEKLANQVKNKTPNLHAISHVTTGQYVSANIKKTFASVMSMTWPIVFFEYEGFFLQKFQRELSTKWILNAISTGGHILKGKIYFNHMIDLKVSNSKLFRRAVAILQRFTSRSPIICQEALLKSIYETDDLSDEIRNVEISTHTTLAATKFKVVPTALVLLTRNCSVAEAMSRIQAKPVVRETIDRYLTAPGRKRTADQIEMQRDEENE